MKGQTPAEQAPSESIAASPKNKGSNVALRALLGQGGVLLLIGVFGGVTRDQASSGSDLGLMGLLLILAVCAAVGLMAAAAYGIAKQSLMRALGGGLLGTLVGGAVAVFLLLSLPDHRAKAAYDKAMTGMVLATIEFYNHTPDYIHQSYVNGDGGGNLHAYSASRSGASKLSKQWQPGLTATVRWTTSSSDPNGSPEVTWHEQVVPIERYDSGATTVNVHFLPAGQIRLIVWKGEAGSAGYPGPEAPQPPPDWPPWLQDAGADDDQAPSPPSAGQGIPPPTISPRH